MHLLSRELGRESMAIRQGTLAKLNAFDSVITIALGSTLSAILLQESIALAEGALALAC
jgi:uncharacterized membrane protein YcaP (DUF421 family)